MRIKLDNVCKASSNEVGKAICINYIISLSWFFQTPIVPEKVKQAKKCLFMTTERGKSD